MKGISTFKSKSTGITFRLLVVVFEPSRSLREGFGAVDDSFSLMPALLWV